MKTSRVYIASDRAINVEKESFVGFIPYDSSIVVLFHEEYVITQHQIHCVDVVEETSLKPMKTITRISVYVPWNKFILKPNVQYFLCVSSYVDCCVQKRYDAAVINYVVVFVFKRQSQKMGCLSHKINSSLSSMFRMQPLQRWRKST